MRLDQVDAIFVARAMVLVLAFVVLLIVVAVATGFALRLFLLTSGLGH